MTTLLTHKRILLVGGGSGGHSLPLVAVGQLLSKLGADVLLVSDRSVDDWAEKAARRRALPFAALQTGKLHRYPTLRHLATPFQVLAGYFQARRILKTFRPDLVFSKGGHVSVPLVAAAQQTGIPIIIHESDAVLGVANRWASRFARRVCVGYPIDSYPAALRDRLVVTGVPVREEFVQPPRRRPRHQRPRLFITGGSQGAVALNSLVLAAADRLLAVCDIVHLTGQGDYPRLKAAARPGYQIEPVTDEMASHMVQADLILSRASASTLAEIAILGRPALLVPLPQAANDHARLNARVWETAGAAIVFAQRHLTADDLVRTVRRLLRHPDRLRAMGRASRTLAVPDAAQRVVAVISAVLHPPGPITTPDLIDSTV